MNATGRRELRQLRRDASDVLRAVADTFVWWRTILDPPPRDGWPARFHLRKVKR